MSNDHIVPELRPMARAITDAQPHPRNARIHNLQLIAHSLRLHGQFAPIVVQASTGYIVKGNGTWAAAAQFLSWDTLAQSWQDMDDEEALRRLIDDNETSDGARIDAKGVAEILADLGGEQTTVFTEERMAELEDLIEAAAGAMELPPLTEVPAEFADAAYAEEREAEAAAPGTKHREVPLVMPVEDHAEFVRNVLDLRAKFGTRGTVATVFEALKRQAAAEPEAGMVTDPSQRNAIRRELVNEVRSIVLAGPEPLTKAWILAQLEGLVPFRTGTSQPGARARSAGDESSQPAVEQAAEVLEVQTPEPVHDGGTSESPELPSPQDAAAGPSSDNPFITAGLFDVEEDER